MMGLSGMSFGTPSVDMSNFSGGDDSRIKSLEQKLQRLNKEKRKAAENNDVEKEKKLEKQIEQVKKQIDQLKRKKQKEKKEPEQQNPQNPENQAQMPDNLLTGANIDMLV